MAASRAGARKPLGAKTSNVPTAGALAKRAGIPAAPQALRARGGASSDNARLQLQRFASLWLVTPDEARKQQLVDGVPGPFKHVALAYESVSGKCGLALAPTLGSIAGRPPPFKLSPGHPLTNVCRKSSLLAMRC